MPLFEKVLVANRGEIACRILRTLRRMRIQSVAVYADADAYAEHVTLADEAVRLGPAPVSQSYLNQERVLEAARDTGAQALHPGYGLLSENADFAEACGRNGLVFIGPTPDQMRRFGLKHTARALAQANDVPLLPGTGLLQTWQDARDAAREIGYPVMLKSTAGGGGIGMRLCHGDRDLENHFAAVQRLSRSNFASDGVFLEKFVESARHVEVQIFGDGRGQVLALGERDCSLQRRNQKVVEETPAPNLNPSVRQTMSEAAVRLAAAQNYRSAGTVEFIYDADSEAFYFLEVNTRLQVEHGVTELVAGLDLVEWMVRLAAGELDWPAAGEVEQRGAAIEARIYAEDPIKDFQPSSGLLTRVAWPSGARCDTWVQAGTEITPHYDPLLAKILVHADTREEAVAKLSAALAETKIDGIATNLAYLRQAVAAEAFQAGRVTTKFLATLRYQARAVEVLQPGTMTTVQDLGRFGYWNVGVPPSGPMDALAFRLANRLLDNDDHAAGLEITVSGPTLLFHEAAQVVLTGPAVAAEMNGAPLPMWQVVEVPAGSTLKIGEIRECGCRCYLAVAGGFDVPEYLGSKATFTLGKFGGHAGRALRMGDVLPLALNTKTSPTSRTVPVASRPVYAHEWTIRVIEGPHAAPEFFTARDMDMFHGTAWEVHYNSSRTGVRLVGPKPEWARADGGEAGLHPSNIHDNAYAVGTIDFTGDMPIILGPDGPSLGGFVCPATIIHADLWKVGQLRAGDKVRFQCVDQETARQLEEEQETFVAGLASNSDESPVNVSVPSSPGDGGVLHRLPATPERVEVTYRQAGDKYLLIEYGPLVLDLTLRFRVHALMEWLARDPLPGILDQTPGIRSLQIHFDSRELPLPKLLETLIAAEDRLPAMENLVVKNRVVHLPLSWDDVSTQRAIEKYMQSVRKDAPWCPSNIEFIRRINGLASIDEVRGIVFDASYLVLGLGDVYLGAPVATPLDPRHRLVTTKYNPARTWTPENAVGIGGAYLCIYGMEGPGGYQFVGRTVPVWNRWRQTREFERPWLLRFFDEIRFYPMAPDELLTFREDLLHGRASLKIEEGRFSLGAYQRFLRDHADSIRAFKETQSRAFEEERLRWAAAHDDAPEESSIIDQTAEAQVPSGVEVLPSPITGNVWKISVREGDRVEANQVVTVVEAMKMEVNIHSPKAGIIEKILVQEGSLVQPGQNLLYLKPDDA